MTPENLDGYDIIADYTSWWRPTEEQCRALLDAVAGGKGYFCRQMGVPKVVCITSEAARGQRIPITDVEICDEETPAKPDYVYALGKYVQEVICEYFTRIEGVKTICLMSKKIITNSHRPIYPTPVGLITCVDRDGKPNIITLGEVAMVSMRPTRVSIGARPATYSNGLIKATGEFVINFPTVDIIEAVDFCGTWSGRDVDKFAETGLTPEPAIHVKPPLIKECPVNLECSEASPTPSAYGKVIGTLSLGSHDLFIGDVLVMHAEEEIVLDSNTTMINLAKAKGVIFAMEEYWSFGERIAAAHFTGRKKRDST